MPIIKSAKKALKSSARKKVFNDRRSKVMKSSIKDVKKLVLDKQSAEARKKLSEAYQAIDKAAKRGIIKKNTASRKKSRLSKLVKNTK
ncbi:MAG: 30S ribosomal protein S20 [Candidatus Vogelbacteria bacterium]|nr:30S ribosomal protein S20 [Candidatus Vogelbacteria bacterium]